MNSIRPVSDLRNNFADISKTVHETGQPVFLTKNGYGDMVVLSMEAYEKLQLDSEIYFKLKEAERELKNRVAPETFQAYELYAVQHRPVEKVAAYLNCSVNQVYQAKKRCFAMMREILLKMNEQDPALKLELSHYGI